jgi:hypothetical protein
MKPQKYTEEQLKEVERLKRLKKSHSEITKLTGVPNHKIKQIVSSLNLYLTEEDKQKNASEGRYGVENPKMVHEAESYKEKMKERKITLEEEVLNIIKYSKITLFSIDSHKKTNKIIFTCREHGNFERSFNLIKQTQECISCSRVGKPQHTSFTIEEVRAFVLVRGYELASTEYQHSQALLDIKCPKHGIFNMHINAFNMGQGCRKCSNFDPKPEREIREYIISLGFNDLIEKDRKTINPLEIDCFIPSKMLAIEHDGLYWHSRKRVDDDIKRQEKNGTPYTEEYIRKMKQKKELGHFEKFRRLEEKGIAFFPIYGDDWIYKNELVKGMIRNRLGLYDKKIRASKLTFKILTKNKEFAPFFEKYHIDGHSLSSYAYALCLEDKIISCMSFRTSIKGELMEIARYATDYDYRVYGAFSRMLKHYPRDIDLMSFSNNRVGSGNVYQKHGFEQIKNIYIKKDGTHDIKKENYVGYSYTDLDIRVNRHSCQRRNEPEIMALYNTEEKQALAGVLSEPFGHNKPIFKIYDCGNKKWILRKK